MESSKEKLIYLNNKLIYATQNGQLEEMKKLITEGASVNTLDVFHNNLLIMATHVGSFDILEYLLNLGLDIHAKNALNSSALDIAKNNGREDIVDYFNLPNRKNLVDPDTQGKPIHFAYTNNPVGIEAMSKSCLDSEELEYQSTLNSKKNKSKKMSCFGF